jgi:hypothetical protein
MLGGWCALRGGFTAKNAAVIMSLIKYLYQVLKTFGGGAINVKD